MSIIISLIALPVLAASGVGWQPDSRATQDPTGAGQDETAIAANPLDPANAVVVTKDYREHVVDYVYTTTDGGATWLEQPFPSYDAALPEFTDPYVYFRRDGRAYLVWTQYRDFYWSGLFTAWSDDRGRSWSPPRAITPPGPYFDDKASLTFDYSRNGPQGAIHALWTRFGNAETYSARSLDGGATWSAPVQVSGGAFAEGTDGAQAVVLADGSLLTVYFKDVSAESGTLVRARSTDGGLKWSEPVALFEVVKPPFHLPGEAWHIFFYHALARDPISGALAVVWPDNRDAATEGLNILSSRSTNDGLTWSAPSRLNDDPAGLVRDQFFPALAASTDGRLTAVWLDRRDDPANRLYHAYARTSLDGGLTWQPSVRISSAPSDPNVNIPAAADGIGDYIGVSASPGASWASWVDVRNLNQDIYAAREVVTPLPSPTPTSTATPCAMRFSDVAPSDYFYEAVRFLFCRGVVSGYADGTFHPDATTTRAQTAKVIVLGEGWLFTTTGAPHFTDVPPGSPFYAYVETAFNHGVVSGYSDGTFRPGNNVTRAQLVKLIVLAEGWAINTAGGPHFSDVAPGSPFYDYVETAFNRGVVTGYADGTFRPGATATRGQAAKVLYIALNSRGASGP